MREKDYFCASIRERGRPGFLVFIIIQFSYQHSAFSTKLQNQRLETNKYDRQDRTGKGD